MADATPPPTTPFSVRRALLSVSDKAGLIELATALAKHGVEMLSTGGTAKAIREAGLPVKDASVTQAESTKDRQVAATKREASVSMDISKRIWAKRANVSIL